MAPRKSKAQVKEDNAVLAALSFVALAQQAEGAATYQTHCRIINNQMIAYNGILAAGVAIDPAQITLPDICPNTFQFIHALERAKDVSSVVFEDGRVTVRTQKFRAVVPCVPGDDVYFVGPDPAMWPLSDEFHAAASRAALFTRDGAEKVVMASVLTRDGSIVGTDARTAVIEAWHGLATPPGQIIPKSFIDAIGKSKKKIAHFGYTDQLSFTVWFDDGSWLKTQLYGEKWPSVTDLLAHTDAMRPHDAPAGLWEGLRAISPFAKDGHVYIGDGLIQSSKYANQGAEYKVKLIGGIGSAYSFKTLSALEPVAKQIDFETNERFALFRGENIRGVVSKGR